MAQPKKNVRTLHDRLKIIEEVEKNPGEKRVDIAKRLGLSASTLKEEDEEDENEQEMVPSFPETYEAWQKVKAFFYVQSGSDADRENILSLKKSYFQLRQNSTKKQRTMYDFFVKKQFF